MKSPTKNIALTLAKQCREIIENKKAEDVVVLDLREVTSVADYFVICSGTSEPHLKALADTLTTDLRAHGFRPNNQAGDAASRWIVLDYGDVLVHIFHPEMRGRYSLDHLWGDAKRVR